MIDVRLATADEAEVIHQITIDAFEYMRDMLDPPSDAFSETLEEVQQAIDNNQAVIATVDTAPAGACRMIIYDDHVYCGRLGVFPSMQGKGIGKAILNYLEDEARKRSLPEVRLATREPLAQNVEYYQRQGYVIIGRSKHMRGIDMILEFAKAV